MASWSPSPSPSPTTPSPLSATAVSDCPQCGSVCVGGLLLPCGHLTCRKCLRDHHGSQLTCHTCQHRLPLPKDQGSADFSSLVQQLGVDPVMALMVNERLRGQGRQACLVCENREATTVCQDCNEFYCHSCARMHGRQRMSRDHVMQPLSQALRNVSSADCAVPKPRTHSASSCGSMDIISNPMDQPTSPGPSRGSTRWKQWVRHEVGMLQVALSEQDALVTGLTKVLTVAEKRQTLLQCYDKSLSLFDVTQQDDDNTFNITVAHDDVSMPVKLDSLQQRLRDVIDGPQDASFTSDVRQLIKQLDDVLSMQGNWNTSAQSSTTQSVGFLQSSTASSKTSVTSPSLSSLFATPTVNMSTLTSSAATPTSSAAMPTSTASKTTLNISTPTSYATSTAVTPTSTAQKTTLNMSTPASSAATLTRTATKTTNTMAVTPATSTLVATTIISNSAAIVMPANTAATPIKVSFSSGALTANTVTTVATPTATTVNAFTTISSVATPTNNAVTPTNNAVTPTSSAVTPTNNAVTPTNNAVTPTNNAVTPTNNAVTPTNNAVTPTNTTNVTLTPTNTSAHAATTDSNATPTTSTFTAVSSSAKPINITAVSSAITAFTNIFPATTTAPAITSPPISSVATPTTTLDTKQKSTKNITYSNTTAPPTDKQATPTSTPVTNPSMSSTKDRATSNRTSITKPGMATDTNTTTNDKPTLANTNTTTNDKPTLANTTTTTNDKPTLADFTPINKVRAAAAITTTASPACAATPTCTPSVDPMTARPRRAFSVRPVCDHDRNNPIIISMISTRDGQRLVMTDVNNNKVKVVDLYPPHKMSAALTVIEIPHCLALLPDDLVAMGTYHPVIYLLNITDSVTVTSRIQTDVTYLGVGGLSDGRLIVSCNRRDNNGVARVDIITRDGNVVTTITDTSTLTRLRTPWLLSVVDSHVLLSDCVSDAVFKVDIGSGHLVDTFSHRDMYNPYQLTADGSGNMYIANYDCVLVRSAGGQWRKLVEASQHSDEGYDRPSGVCLTSDGRLVVAWNEVLRSDSVVIAYDL